MPESEYGTGWEEDREDKPESEDPLLEGWQQLQEPLPGEYSAEGITGSDRWPVRHVGDPLCPPTEGLVVKNEDLPALVEYARWAKGKIAALRAELLDQMAQRKELETHSAKQAEALRGLEAWQKLRSNALQALELGAQVQVNNFCKGTVQQVIIDRGGVYYRVRYWVLGAAHEDTFHSTEVTPVDDDILPHRPKTC